MDIGVRVAWAVKEAHRGVGEPVAPWAGATTCLVGATPAAATEAGQGGSASNSKRPGGTTHGGGDNEPFSTTEEYGGDAPPSRGHAPTKTSGEELGSGDPRCRGGRIWRLTAQKRPRCDANQAVPMSAARHYRSDEGEAGSDDRSDQRRGQ
jgi:hypothetical protein